MTWKDRGRNESEGDGNIYPALSVVTAAQSEAIQERVAGAALTRGISLGDRLVLQLPPSATLVCAVIGLLRVGIIPVMLNPGLVEQETNRLLEDCRPSLVVNDEGLLSELTQGPQAGLAPYPLSRPMHYTSGTTGQPKGVLAPILATAQARQQLEDEADLWGFTKDDRFLVVSPTHHSAPLRFATCVLMRGGTVAVLSKFKPQAVAGAIENFRPSATFMVPTHLRRLFAPPSYLESVDLSCFRIFLHAGEACPPAIKLQAIAAFPPGTVHEFYGSTEGQFTSCTEADWRSHPGTVGRSRPDRTIWVDDHGVIWCKVPSYAHFSYFGDPTKTSQCWREGSFTVGDLGRVDDDGFVYLEGRRDDLVISGGVNVYPAEVEAALHAVDGVEAIAVFGLDDPEWGQKLCAAYVGDADEISLASRAAECLAPYKRPKDYFKLDSLPTTDTGKIKRSTLRESLMGKS